MGKRQKSGFADSRNRKTDASEAARDAAFENAMLERLPPPTPWRIGLRLAAIVTVAVLTWRAVHYRGATAGALLLPFAAEIAAAWLVAALLLVVVRDPKFAAETRRGMIAWPVLLAIAFFWHYATYGGDAGALAHLRGLGERLYAFAERYAMVGAMIAGAGGFVAAVIPDVSHHLRHGGHFVYLGSLSLAFRAMTLLVLTFWLAWAFDSNRRQRAEVLWFMLLVAELVALTLPYLAQRKLRQEKEKGKPGGKTI